LIGNAAFYKQPLQELLQTAPQQTMRSDALISQRINFSNRFASLIF
jgi:hypothetical protein